MGDMYMQTKSRYQTARRILLFWTLFIGVGAAAGAAGMLLDPSGKAMGMDAMLPYFQVLPFADVLFRDLTFSGWALLIVNGLTNLTAASLLLAKKNAGITLGGLFGVTLMLWIRIQFGNVKKCAVGKHPKSEKLGSTGQAACCARIHSRYFTGGSPSGLRV